jgi:SAM-dependent methyltransferase
LRIGSTTERDGEVIVTGTLACTSCSTTYPIRDGIPRFVSTVRETSFARQWAEFHRVQRDSYTGTTWVRDLIATRTGWSPDHLRTKTVIECGCGSGNDTEILVEQAGTLVSFDYSSAVDYVPQEIRAKPNFLLVQGDMGAIPAAREAFDVVYCHRAIQHTPDPAASFEQLASCVGPGGEMFLHCYDTHPRSRLQAKYLYRPLTKRLPYDVVRRFVLLAGPVMIPLVKKLQALGPLGYLPRAVIPFVNMDREIAPGSKLTPEERYALSVLVTIDALTPAHDHPQSPATLRRWFAEKGFDRVELRGRNPVLMLAHRPATFDRRAAAPRA